MASQFHYDSRDHHLPFTRTKRFVIYLLVVLALSLALNFTHYYFTDWSHAEDTASNQIYLLLAIALLGLALFGVAMVVSKLLRNQGYDSHQYLILEGNALKWQFNTTKGAQELDLSKVDSAVSDPRHLIFKSGEEEIWLENYLIIDQAEWEKFMAVLRKTIPVN